MNQFRQVSFRRSPAFAGAVAAAHVRHAFDPLFAGDIAAPKAPAAAGWAPRVDVREEADRFLIFADVPGVNLADIEIEMEKNVLSLKGERKVFAGEAEGQFSRVERQAGSFLRTFALPETADAEGITASGSNGVLEIVIPKKAVVAPRRIAVNAAG